MNNSHLLRSINLSNNNINTKNNLKTDSNKDLNLEFDFSLCHYDYWLYSC